MPKTENEFNPSLSGESQSQVKSGRVSPRLSFKEAIEKVRGQIDIACFGPTEKEFANEIIMIIAEIFMLRDDSEVKIGGEQLDAYIVKQVLEQVREDHVQLVIENFNKVEYIVNFKKTYIRTALYNAVFEIEAHYMNLVRHDLGL